jgi:CheY-like chemotaxis protein
MNPTPNPTLNPNPSTTPMRRILVVDDNPMNAQLAHIILKRAGFDAPTVESAPLALDYLVGNKVDVILTDVSMPGMSGSDLCRTVFKRYGENRPRMVAYTAFAMSHQRAAILEAGFDALLVKPASTDAILAAINGNTEDLQ